MLKQKPYKSPEFLKFAKHQIRKCIVCEQKYGTQLHHFGKRGIGQKATDLLVCRVCKECHDSIQGKSEVGFERLGQTEIWIKMQADALELLMLYVQSLEAKQKNWKNLVDEAECF